MALDELGRGTATMDGVAIAGAVLEHVAGAKRCRGVFATHYHVLADEFAGSERVSVKHMACDVDAAGPRGVPKARLPSCGLACRNALQCSCLVCGPGADGDLGAALKDRR